MFTATTATKKVMGMKARIRILQGGTSASKTISALLYLIHRAQSDKVKTLSSVVSESLPHLKKGAIRDFLNIMESHNYFDDARWNRSDFTYTFETGSKIEFFSADQPAKVRGPRRDRLFLNEANNVPYETFDQLEVRTKEFIIIDFNPVADFWVTTDVEDVRTDAEKIILTYKDNEALPIEIVKSIEQRMNNKSWWQVYGLGLPGEIEGRIYTGWRQVDEVPHEAKLWRRGLDFGYTNDPSALIDVYKLDGGFILDEQLYQKGMLNKAIADYVLNMAEKQTLIIGDSAEPKSIAELKIYGLNIIGVTKGQGSLNQGIQYVQEQRISYTKRSINLRKEYNNYVWQQDNDGKFLNVPCGGMDHGLDAARYAFDVMTKRDSMAGRKPTYRVRGKRVTC